jgi:hypothetical protein
VRREIERRERRERRGERIFYIKVFRLEIAEWWMDVCRCSFRFIPLHPPILPANLFSSCSPLPTSLSSPTSPYISCFSISLPLPSILLLLSKNFFPELHKLGSGAIIRAEPAIKWIPTFNDMLDYRVNILKKPKGVHFDQNSQTQLFS